MDNRKFKNGMMPTVYKLGVYSTLSDCYHRHGKDRLQKSGCALQYGDRRGGELRSRVGDKHRAFVYVHDVFCGYAEGVVK